MTEDGIRYERFCCEYLSEKGFVSKTTATTGDQGVDIIAEKDGIKYAIQCKYREIGTIGNDAVQQVIAGKNFYDCDVAVVIANVAFSASATRLADKLRVRLWTVELPPQQSLGDIINTKETIAEFKESIKHLVERIRADNTYLEKVINHKEHFFMTTNFSLNDECDNEKVISGYMDKLSIDYNLLFKSKIVFENVYMFGIAVDSSVEQKIYVLATNLIEDNMVLERISDNVIVVIESVLESHKDYIKSEKDRLIRSRFASYIVTEAKLSLGVDIVFVAAEQTKNEKVTDYFFYSEQSLDAELHKKLEDSWNRKYKGKIVVDIFGPHKLGVYVSVDEPCNASDDSSLLVYSPNGVEDYLMLTSSLSESDNSLTITALLRTVDIEDLLNCKYGTPNNKYKLCIWHDLKYYLMSLYELTSVSAVHNVGSDDIEMRFDSRGLLVIAPKRRCCKFRVLDKRGHTILSEEHCDVSGIVVRNYMFDSVLKGDEFEHYGQPGKGYLSVYYRIAELYDTVTDDENNERNLGISDVNAQMETELHKTLSIINSNADSIKRLFGELTEPKDDESVRVKKEIVNNNMELTTYYRR